MPIWSVNNSISLSPNNLPHHRKKISLLDEILFYTAAIGTAPGVPYADQGVMAGFPSPAQDYMEKSIDLNDFLITNRSSCFVAKVVGTSMIDMHIQPGDLVVVDKAVMPHDGNVVVAYINGEFTMKKIDFSERKTKGIIWLRPANPAYPSIRITADEDFRVWGVVTGHIRKL